MTRLRRILALKCAESARLVSESLDRDLSASERWAVRVHACICRSCRRFRHQIEFLRLAARSAPGAVSWGLSVEARERIRRAVVERQAWPPDPSSSM